MDCITDVVEELASIFRVEVCREGWGIVASGVECQLHTLRLNFQRKSPLYALAMRVSGPQNWSGQ